MEFTGICLITDVVPSLARFCAALTGAVAAGDDTHVEINTAGASTAFISTAVMETLVPWIDAGG